MPSNRPNAPIPADFMMTSRKSVRLAAVTSKPSNGSNASVCAMAGDLSGARFKGAATAAHIHAGKTCLRGGKGGYSIDLTRGRLGAPARPFHCRDVARGRRPSANYTRGASNARRTCSPFFFGPRCSVDPECARQSCIAAPARISPGRGWHPGFAAGVPVSLNNPRIGGIK